MEKCRVYKKIQLYGQVRTIRPVTPYPGCPLYYEAIEKGLLEGPDDFYNKFTFRFDHGEFYRYGPENNVHELI